MPTTLSYANTISQTKGQSRSIDSLRKDISMIDGVPQITWTEEKVNIMNEIEDLQFAVIGKFTFYWTNLEELRKIIPQQCG